jgi:hypothetical protein
VRETEGMIHCHVSGLMAQNPESRAPKYANCNYMRVSMKV